MSSTDVNRGGLPSQPSPLPEVQGVSLSDIADCLRLGWRDFLRAPAFGLFFSAIYTIGGIIMYLVFAAAGQEWWLMPVVVGFPLLAPFAAVGLYEVSRRLETGQPLIWREVLGVVFAQKDRQVPSMAMVVLLMFMFWVFMAHGIFALFLGTVSLVDISHSPQVLFRGSGPFMLAFGSAVGAGFAAVLFAITVGGLPMVLERNVDFISAIIRSFQAVTANLGVMIVWGLVIAALIFLGMLPLFLGLLIVLPVLGHASWHMYRRLLADDPA
ncbi:DUF2189 domain-containing protein [Paracoccus sp. p4-l81]|uniref:DUF2189 domain-containing protein n=1 Tax=unclassified Paracoccus (in: a-proteobacteria) TaxID=2688777 RepID=UPI0035B8FC43